MFLDSSSGFNLGTSNPKMVVSLHSTLIHGSHIWTLAWSSVSSAYTDSDPVSQLALVHLREAAPLFCSSPISGFCSILLFRWCVYGSFCWPLLTSLASSCLCDQRNHQLAEHVHGGDAVRLRCGERRAPIYRLSSGHAHRGVADFIIVTQELATVAIPLMGSDPVFPSRMTSARSASWFSWLTPSLVAHFCWGLFQRPKEGQWWR